MSYSTLPVAQSEMESITWLPYAGIRKSVRSLDSYELRQSWISGYHTMRTLLGCRNPIEWPTVAMWRGYETGLASYLYQTIMEMTRRRFLFDLRQDLFLAVIEDGPRVVSGRVTVDLDSISSTTKELYKADLLPSWFGWRPLHQSHRESLVTGDVLTVRWPGEGRTSGKIRSRILQAG